MVLCVTVVQYLQQLQCGCVLVENYLAHHHEARWQVTGELEAKGVQRKLSNLLPRLNKKSGPPSKDLLKQLKNYLDPYLPKFTI